MSVSALPIRITRRVFMVAVTTALGAAPRRAACQADGHTPLEFFTALEWLFIDAACECLIPAGPNWPGARELRAAHYVDHQLAGAWGGGERIHREGPWQPGTAGSSVPGLAHPAAFFRTTLRAIIVDLESDRLDFSNESSDRQRAYLCSLEAGNTGLDRANAAAFFAMLLQMTVEGYFTNLGNRTCPDRITWRLANYPGAHSVLRSPTANA